MNIAALKEAALIAGACEWDLVPANEHHGPYIVGPAGDVADFYTMTNPQSLSVRNGGDSRPVLFVDAVENAAFAALANPSAILSLIERAETYEAALTPSADTKAAYIGEFAFNIETLSLDEDGEPVDCTRRVEVPWSTIKEIMAAIRDRAALSNPTETVK
jgi:hypothetical protein